MNMNNQELDEHTVYSVLQSILPEQNDDDHSDYQEELQELRDFNIHTCDDLRRVLLKHRERLLEIDREPLDAEHIRWYSEDLGEEFVNKAVEHGDWFAYPALLRIALELEFGEAYQAYANARDGIGEQRQA
jgi:hypothetical protein